MQSRIRSVNVGRPAPVPGQRHLSGIDKRPVTLIEVRAPGPKHGGLGSGVIGDHVGEPQHHGGDGQAVYAVAAEELAHWAAELGRDLPPGSFGENLTTEGFDVDGSLIGEQWRTGTALLEVTGPRIPCQTFAGHLGERGWVKRFSEHGRPGAYLAVIEPGRISPGDGIRVEYRPGHDITVSTLFRALLGDRDLARAALDAGAIWPTERASLEKRLEAWEAPTT